MKHIKILGLLAMAALVVAGLLGTTTASAAKFTSSAGGLTLNVTTVGNHVFTVTGSKMECKKITFTGTTAGTESETQTVKPKYEECIAFLFANSTVDTTGCSYTFHSGVFNSAGTDHTTGSPTGHGTMDLSGCTSHAGGWTITVSVPFIATCKVFVYNQNGINGIHYTDKGEGDIIVETTATNIKAKVTESTGACPFTPGSTHENASYTGSSTVKAASGTLSYDPS